MQKVVQAEGAWWRPLAGPAPALAARLLRPVDGASLAVFRILFGLLLCAGCARTVLNGWVDILFVQPRFFFKYPGFEWVAPWPGCGMVIHYWALSALAFSVAIGFCYRASIVLFTLGFAYAQLIDATNYLNHYYLVVLLGALMSTMPLHRLWSVDAWLRPTLRSATAPAWCLYLLRFQYGVVYFYAGLAKVGTDWLVHAQPLGLWMAARDDTPLVGPLLGEAWVAYAMSWAGCLYDLTIWAWLSWRRTRLAAFVVLVAFHALTLFFFQIGIFPFVMTLGGLLFFAPGWPRRWLALLPGARSRESTGALPAAAEATAPAPAPAATPALALAGSLRLRAGLALGLAYCAFQVLFPLRHLAYPGCVLWDEQGIRWSWKVLVREKNGAIAYRVRGGGIPGEWEVSPNRYLLPRQHREMWNQPDFIRQLAHRIADDMRGRGISSPEVRVDARVSLNGRAARPMIDPSVDLARIEDGLAPARWILPGPTEPPFPAGAGARARRDATATTKRSPSP